MLTEHIGLSLSIGNSQPNARRGKLALSKFELAVHAFFNALLGDGLGFVGGSLGFGKRVELSSEIDEFGIRERSVEDHFCAFVLNIEGTGLPVDPGGLEELL